MQAISCVANCGGGNQSSSKVHGPVTEGCGVLETSICGPEPSWFPESDNALPKKLIHSCGVVLVFGQRLQHWVCIEPELVNFSCSLGLVMPLCITLSAEVKYFHKILVDISYYYLIVGIELLNYSCLKKCNMLI